MKEDGLAVQGRPPSAAYKLAKDKGVHNPMVKPFLQPLEMRVYSLGHHQRPGEPSGGSATYLVPNPQERKFGAHTVAYMVLGAVENIRLQQADDLREEILQ